MGVVVARLKIVQSGCLIVLVAPIAQGVGLTEGIGETSGGGKQFAPCVVGIFYHTVALSVKEGNNISLQIGNVIVFCSVPNQGKRGALVVIPEVEQIGSVALRSDSAIRPGIPGGCGAVRGFCPQSVRVIPIGIGGIPRRKGGKLSAHFPGKGHAVPIGQGVADCIVGDGLAIIGGQQIFPRGVAVGVCFGFLHRTQFAHRIIIRLDVFDIAANIIDIYRGAVPRIIDPGELTCLVIFIGR